MNRRDFYKQLMNEYTFDAAKVRRAAKLSCLSGNRGSLRKSNNRRRWYIPVTAVAAAFAIVFGLYAALGERGGDSVPAGNPIDSRIQLANRSVASLSGRSIGSTTAFLSFRNTMTFSQMQMTLESAGSDDDTLVVQTVYVYEQKGTISLMSPTEAAANSVRIIGAKVFAPVPVIQALQVIETVSLVETKPDDFNDEDFVPLAVEIAVRHEQPELEPPPIPIEVGDPILPPHEIVDLTVSDVIEAYFISDYRFVAIKSNVLTVYEIAPPRYCDVTDTLVGVWAAVAVDEYIFDELLRDVINNRIIMVTSCEDSDSEITRLMEFRENGTYRVRVQESGGEPQDEFPDSDGRGGDSDEPLTPDEPDISEPATSESAENGESTERGASELFSIFEITADSVRILLKT